MVTRTKAIAKLQLENSSVIVTEWRFAPGAETGWHRHAYDYVVVPTTTGTLLLESQEGTHLAELTKKQSYFRKAGIEHNVVNNNSFDFCFIEIELK